MIVHYLKIAFRNLWKYKQQTLVSVLGLAVGLTCFALSFYWERYERNYDVFHPEADCIYQVFFDFDKADDVIGIDTPYPLADWLKTNFPEVKAACHGKDSEFSFHDGKNQWHNATHIVGSVEFSKVFGLPEAARLPLYGDNYPLHQTIPCLITDEAAARYFPDQDVVGKELFGPTLKYEIIAVIKAWPPQSNSSFDFILPPTSFGQWVMYNYYTYILLEKGVDVQALQEKVNREWISMFEYSQSLRIVPLRDMNIQYPKTEKFVNYSYLRLFSLLGLIVALSSLLNYLILYINRLRIRDREFSLRFVAGANLRSVFRLLALEFSLPIFFATLVSCLFLILFVSSFRQLTDIAVSNSVLVLTCIAYVLLLTGIIFLCAFVPIFLLNRPLFKGKAHQELRNRQEVFYKVSLFVQLCLCVGVVFCGLLFVKQLRYQSNMEIGYERKVAIVQDNYHDPLYLLPLVKSVPEIDDFIPVPYHFMLHRRSSGMYTLTEWEGNTERREIEVEEYSFTSRFIDFFGFTFTAGHNFDDELFKGNEVILNEQAVQALGWDNPIGKTLQLGGQKTVIGVVKNFYLDSPYEKSKPVVILHTLSTVADVWPFHSDFQHVAYKYTDDNRNTIERCLRREIEDECGQPLKIQYIDDHFNDFLRSEENVLRLLSIVSILCLVISAFGVYSLMSFICLRRRKEIAIRKVNGAGIRTVFVLLLKEYAIIYLFAAIVGFAAGYRLVIIWLEGFTRQTNIPLWFYLSVFVGIGLILLGSIAFQILKTVRENPADVLKSE